MAGGECYDCPMSDPGPSGVTRLLVQWREGDREALDELTPIVYNELRRLARRYMGRERSGHLLQTTALVHEAYLKLVGLDVSWQGRVHFFAVAARLMRRVLVDYARERDAAKRGGAVRPLELDEARIAAGKDGAQPGSGLPGSGLPAVDGVRVEWPDGREAGPRVEDFAGLEAGRYHTLRQGEGRAGGGDG